MYKKSENRDVYIDKAGQKGFNNEFLGAYSFSEGLAVVKGLYTSEDNYEGANGYIDKTGKPVIELGDRSVGYFTVGCRSDLFDGLGDFSEGLAVINEGYIDKTGNIVIPIGSLEMLFDFHDGLAMVGICEEWAKERP